MKKLFYCAAALATMFFAACQQESLEPAEKGTAVNFTVAVPGEISTKAVADGNNVDELYYAIYKYDETSKSHENGVDNADATPLASGRVDRTAAKHFNVTFDLLADQNYVAIFWAQVKVADPFYVWPENGDLRTITFADKKDADGNWAAVANLEERAAFFRTYEFNTTTPQDHKVDLYRPFAQLNLGTTLASLEPQQEGANVDYVIDVEESQVKVTGLATAFNTISGLGVEDICGKADEAYSNTFVFTLNDVITASTITDDTAEREYLTVKDKEGKDVSYEWVAMNYFFATDNGNVKVDYEIVTDKGVVTNTVDNVPVKENFRTNIIGNLLTSKTDFEIIVDAAFEQPDYDLHMVFDEYQLQAALDAATVAGDYTFYVGADIVGDVTVTQREGVNIVIDGSKYEKPEGPKFDGVITINGNARANGAETLTIKNLNFQTKTAKTFIDAPTKINGKYNYSHNVTVENCTFSAETYNEGVVGIKLFTTYNAVVRNCSAKNIHSLAQFQSTDNATVIENVTVENCKNGISLGNIASATITGANISAKGYGVRLDGEKTREVAVTISESTIAAYIPVNVRKMNNDACKAVVKFEGENSLTGDSYEIAFCSNEYEEGVAPAAPVGTFTLDGAEGFDAYYGPLTSVSAFEAAINSTGDVEVEAPITSVGVGFEVERDVVFNFDGNELNAGSDANSRWYALEIYGENTVEINDANFTRAGVYAASGADVVFNSGVINHKPERSSRYIFCAQSGSTITIEDGTFYNDRQNNAYFWADNATIYVNGGTFTGVASKNKVVLTNGGQLVITGGTFNFDPSAYVAVGYVASKVGSNWEVVAASNGTKYEIDGVEYTYANDAAGLSAAISSSDAVILADGAYTMPAISGKEVTIKGSKNTVITVNKPNMSGSDVTFDGVTVKGSGYATGVQHVNTVTYKNATIVGEMCLYGEKNTFQNCTFELAKGKYIWSYGSKESEFIGCTFNTAGKALLVYNEGAGANKVTVKNCTFNATAGDKAGAIANQNCAAVEIDNFQSSGVGAAHVVVTENNTYSENFSGEWRIKNVVAGNAITVNGTEYTQIAVDGKLMTIDASKNVTVLE